ncbi:MAG: type II secretion system F family protein [Alistipes sp.]|nr:type II secretion system F family protein [Alistipes sp.]
MSDISTLFKSGRKYIRLRDADKDTLFTELLSLLSSGLDFTTSFQLLISGENNRKVKLLLTTVYDKVVFGSTLWQAMEDTGAFTGLDYGVVRIGEETGRLTESLSFLGDYYRKKNEQKKIVSSATTYPVIILFTALLVVFFMMAFIVPMFEQVYNRMGSELPAITRLIISLSGKTPLVLALLFIAAIGFVIIHRSAKESDTYKNITSRLILRLPVASRIVRKNQQAHFCKLLYLLTASGVPLLTGLDMLSGIMTFYLYRGSLGKIAVGIERGESLWSNLSVFPALYDNKLVTLLRVGEETNKLPEMLEKQGDDLSRSLEHQLKQLGNILEPVMILFVGVIVAVILISMYLPMFKLGGIMQ